MPAVARRLRTAAVMVVAVLAALLLTGARPAEPERGERAASLEEFRSCAAIVRYAREHRRALPYVFGLDESVALDESGASPAPPAPAASEGPTDSGFSGTNVQEEGVDEPDLVKTDGETIFALAGRRLHAIDARSPQPRHLDVHALGGVASGNPAAWPRELLLVGDRALVLASARWGARTALIEVDVSEPADLRVVRTLEVDGAYVSTRLNGSTARVVTTSMPDFPIGPEHRRRSTGSSPRSPRSHWMPSALFRDRSTGDDDRRPLVSCDDAQRPSRFAGLEMLSVITVDLSAGLPPTDVDAVMASGETVYGSTDALYVATERWLGPNADLHRLTEVSTAIHKFDLVSPTETAYSASGEVPGFMLSQWSLSEQEGFLRVASTSAPPWFEARRRNSESFVTVLAEQDGRLAEVGQVGGLGRDERIYAVRFIDDVGYVVTFREVDPLYTLDLSSPAEPRKLGELKVPGYSAYLHPVGEDLLLGIGQNATDRGQLRGAQASLFDVSDLADPTLVARLDIGSGSSEVEYDHRAFLYWPPEELAVMPLEIWGQGWRPRYTGALAFRAGAGSGLVEVGRVSHLDARTAPIRRSLVVGDRLFTLSRRGLLSSDLATLETQAWLPFENDTEE